MKSILQYIFLAFTSFSFFSDLAQTNSVIESSSYNSKSNTTDYVVFPIGGVSLPGRWTKTRYNEVSSQQWFINKDSIKLAIAFTTCDSYQFSKKKLKGFSFVKGFYEWDSQYLAGIHHANREIIISDSINQYVIWRLYNNNYNNYFLVGANKCNVHVYNVIKPSWVEEQKVSFLQDLYLNKK